MRLPLYFSLTLITAALAACSSPSATTDAAATAPVTSPAAPAVPATSATPAIDEAAMNKPATMPEESADKIAMGCVASSAGAIIGKDPSPELLEQARIDAKAEKVRVLKMGEPMTMEYNGGRLNVYLDQKGKIKGVNCG